MSTKRLGRRAAKRSRVQIHAVPADSINASYTASIDAQHTLLLIGGRIMNYPAMGEYGMNIVSLGPGESLRLTISENSGSTWELGDPSIGLGALFSARVARVDRDSVVIERNIIGTSNGLYILRDGRRTRFRFEPDLNGDFKPVRDPLP